jgi:hypothetical protein
MGDWRNKLPKQAIKYSVVAVAAANCAGIYLAHQRLNQPIALPVTDTFVAAADYADAPTVRPDAPQSTSLALAAPAPAFGLSSPADMSTLPPMQDLPALAALPLEPATVIPSVPVRTAHAGTSQNHFASSMRVRRASAVDRGFDSAFTPDYGALTPYNGTAEASATSDALQQAAPMESSEPRIEAVSADISAPSTAVAADASSTPSQAPVQTAPAAPAELPSVQNAAPVEQLPG